MVRTSTDSTAGLNIIIEIIIINIVIVAIECIIVIEVAPHTTQLLLGNSIFILKNGDTVFSQSPAVFFQILPTMNNLIFLENFPPPFPADLQKI